ncbi:hypothetical protein L915_02456 [Phytophthora nicotianae]|uniref:Uncharacterized protein n=1 Tax=Phytophthora nicotianae TaxID=4792 RepID=W2JQG9_PHYNI|nr:hypothetical protein L915_02456 [Phytophthora nicotianae]ETL47888.1 hypothetical protein L916_02428 [Phytophthora nicotianae]
MITFAFRDRLAFSTPARIAILPWDPLDPDPLNPDREILGATLAASSTLNDFDPVTLLE